MIFCKRASLKDCLYLLPNIIYSKESRRGVIKFGRRLVFQREELRSNLVRIVSEQCSPEAEAERLWPSYKVDLVLAYSGGVYEEAYMEAAADKLVASLFYVELEDRLESYSGPKTVGVVLRCRLPAGPYLADLALRLHDGQVRVQYFGEEKS